LEEIFSVDNQTGDCLLAHMGVLERLYIPELAADDAAEREE
jgi:hypothetical protein